MGKRIGFLGMVVALLLSPVIFTPALAQNVGDPCTGTDRLYTVSGPSSSALICNGSTLELLGKDLSNPVRKGVGTAAPAAMLDVAGEAKIGNTSLACSATTEGAMRYNSTSKEMEYCNGTAWTSLSPAGGGGLKVYQADGTTVVGNLVGTYAADCAGLVYADTTTGQVSSLTSNKCPSTMGSVYFTGSNCSGSAYIYPGNVGYCCTGSSACTTSLCIAGSTIAPTIVSSRNSAGVCANNTAYTLTGGAYTNTSVCGTGKCLVK